MRKCITCGKSKELTEFGKFHWWGKDLHYKSCKECKSRAKDKGWESADKTCIKCGVVASEENKAKRLSYMPGKYLCMRCENNGVTIYEIGIEAREKKLEDFKKLTSPDTRRECKKCGVEKPGNEFGRMHQTVFATCKECYEKYKVLKITAENFIKSKIILGEIIRPEKCPCCGKLPEYPLKFYHKDLNKSEEIIWLCNECYKGKMNGATDKVLKNCTI